jgi:hypothetical protein
MRASEFCDQSRRLQWFSWRLCDLARDSSEVAFLNRRADLERLDLDDHQIPSPVVLGQMTEKFREAVLVR